MGIGVAIASLVVGAATTAYTVQKQEELAGQAADERKEARKIQQASEQVKNRSDRRRAAREERIRRARLISTAENSGGAGSSGIVGATSALGANFGAAVADQRFQTLANKGISRALQNESDLLRDAEEVGNFGKLVTSITSSVYDVNKTLMNK